MATRAATTPCQLGARSQSQIPPFDHLDVVVGKADGPECGGGENYQPYKWIGRVGPEHGGKKDRDGDEHAAHGWSAGLLFV